MASFIITRIMTEMNSMPLVRIASKFKHNPPTSLGVIVGKSGIAYRRKEDGVYVLPITALKA